MTRWPWIALAAIVVFAIAVPAVTGPQVADFTAALRPPGPGGPLGTDHSGYDLAVRTASALRISLLLAAICAVLSTVIGLVIGLSSATIGGWFDAVLMRIVDGVNALPHLVVGVVIAALWRGDPVAIVASIALTHWPPVARVVRAELLAAMSSGWVESARLAGASRVFVARRHLLPAVSGQALVAAIVLLPHAVWHESTLSFLGVGLSPDRASLGSLLGQARGDVLLGAWWTLAVPGLALVATALVCAACGARIRRSLAVPAPQVWR
ncbi:Binding-protein-dependent transport systems inner membrane component OS=Tsukamurella paurometabola(strain ATCC 8368 / DSM / CCUG 35730 / CIP 100753 / JCM 10117 / KCTC 9821 / NBRC 16120 / NCIMB 702349 / NCTC 13040)OX=521096 GN=Tpau_1969 PE=3 SV=1 [Tsukamurella paurometabola]|uniref:Binding-protein-dependent transport systems inner membrane component n=1 Tax=Tsukamurella paurometabola (strain ATCC 8368 / DSM 20162 / CCUG 35730 / CIP 100753 / JCM 10117 / KCTC 9821 / NBRC 16120 / NCIMB 702349 / NCTC 13040) TaxID=521096 RepID=D5UNL3_TSUPD|nr:ABC transporter permease [Tsukamurella paurometabola]ADG78581.1 binding-protein-dependent transport systems inner membrane component [Tsukamurella paurometabola DSM 20162]SUP32283.1 Oligopeptide transport system permease protein oppC [Tsukamurella paurometabola]